MSEGKGKAVNAGTGISAKVASWEFDSGVADVFDEHVRQSVPGYDMIQRLVVDVAPWFTRQGSKVIDFGCSTGTTLKLIKDTLPYDVDAVGYDEAAPMIQKAKDKGVNAMIGDISNLQTIPPHSYSFALFTLQFLRSAERQRFLRSLFDSLEEGGAFLLVEKVVFECGPMQDIFTQLYWDMKSRNGLSDEEILNKARSLRGAMYPTTPKVNMSQLFDAGFKTVTPVFQQLCFAGWLALK